MPTFTNPDSVHRASVGAIAPATWGDTVNDDLNALYGDTAWTAVTSFSNSWVNFGSGFQSAGYRKVGTGVLLRGTIKLGTINTAAFVLPAGYRPTATLIFGVGSNGAFGQLNVDASGNVTPAIGSNTSFNLNVNFDTL